MQRQREDMLFGKDYMRLQQVAYAFIPAAGPLAIDASPTSMAIEPEGFNTTHELISAMTYSKAPEFVRMVQLLIGKDAFSKALDHYHTKYAFGNATTADWVAAMDEYRPKTGPNAGVDLKVMAKQWLTRTGHPTITYTTSYDEAKKQYVVNLTQTGFEKHPGSEPWTVPIDWALVSNGKNTNEGVYVMTSATASFTIPDVPTKPDFISIAREWSFFGRVKNGNLDATGQPDRNQLALQALSDPDAVNRRFAYQQLAGNEKNRLITALVKTHGGDLGGISVSDDYVDMHAKILFDDSLCPATRAAILTETESTQDNTLAHHYWAIADARIALLQSVYYKHSKKILAMFNTLNDKKYFTGRHIDALTLRALKRHVLDIIQCGVQYQPIFPATSTIAASASEEKVDLFAIAKGLFEESSFMTDRVMGIRLGLELPDGEPKSEAVLTESAIIPSIARSKSALVSPQDKAAFAKRVKEVLCAHPDSLATYITLVSTLNVPEASNIVSGLVAESFFKPELAGHARGVARAWSMQRKRSLYTEDGLKLTIDLCVRIGKVNQMSAASFIQMFGDINAVDAKTKARLIKAVENIRSQFDPTKETSMVNNLNRLLETTKTSA